MKLPSLSPAIRTDLARGESVVIQLVSTSEAMLNRALAALNAEDRANLDIELSPKEFVMSYLTAAFPVRQMKTFVDDTGKTRSEPMSDEDGRPIFSQEALEMRDNLVERFRSEEHTSELQSLMRISYAVFCLNTKKQPQSLQTHTYVMKLK